MLFLFREEDKEEEDEDEEEPEEGEEEEKVGRREQNGVVVSFTAHRTKHSRVLWSISRISLKDLFMLRHPFPFPVPYLPLVRA